MTSAVRARAKFKLKVLLMIETLKTEMRLDDGWFQIAGVGRWNQRILAFVCFFASRGYGSEPTVCLDAGEARRDETITGDMACQKWWAC